MDQELKELEQNEVVRRYKKLKVIDDERVEHEAIMKENAEIDDQFEKLNLKVVFRQVVQRNVTKLVKAKEDRSKLVRLVGEKVISEIDYDFTCEVQWEDIKDKMLK